jgi:hypothetical protein
MLPTSPLPQLDGSWSQQSSLLLKKRLDLSSALGEAHSRVPAAGGLLGDLIDQVNADAEAELQIHLHRTDGRLAQAIEEVAVNRQQWYRPGMTAFWSAD